MRNVLATLLLSVTALASANAAAATPADLKAMLTCTADEQCVVVPKLCNGWMAVNKDSEGSWKAYHIKMAPVIDCPVAKVEPKPSAAQCVQNNCRIK